MSKPTQAKTIEFIRLGNPWLVGKNVSRVVPVYALHNLLAPDFDRDDAVHAIKHLAFDAAKGLASGLRDRVVVTDHDVVDLEQTVFGLLAPERRVFRDKTNGGASTHGALFPLVAALVIPVASDDGLGKRMRELLESYAGDWQARLVKLLAPATAKDPATAFAMALLRGSSGQQNPSTLVPSKKKLKGLDGACAELVDNLIVDLDDARRVSAIRNLAYAVYFASLMRMVAGPTWERTASVPLVFVYGGLPPGRSGDPIVRAACKSFQQWIGGSWNATIEMIADRIASATYLPSARGSDRLRQQIETLLQERLSPKQKEVDALIGLLERRMEGARFNVAWCRDVVESRTFGFKKSELARRVRSLGANIGFTGPDRGTGNPRLVLDTPLLGVLVRGIVGVGTMDFEDFLTRVTEKFGLVLGLGKDDSIADRMEFLGADGFDAYELLGRNQQMLRERMLRAGMARAYSDSHTEVYNDG